MILAAFIVQVLCCLYHKVHADDECEQATMKGKCCVFPFTFEGEEYDFCATGGPSQDFWCSTTNDYGRDGQWDICAGIKCHICTSDQSWSDCEAQQKEHMCPYTYDQCLTLSKEEGNSSKLFLKKCTANKLCAADNPTCKGPDVMKCDFSCCMGDLCNAASTHSMAGLSLLVVQGFAWFWTLLNV